MANPTVVGFIFDGTADLFGRTIKDLYTELHKLLALPFNLMLTLFIIVIGYSIITAKIDLSANEIWKIIITVLIVAVAFNAGNDLIPPLMEVFIKTPSYLAGELVDSVNLSLGDYEKVKMGAFEVQRPFYPLEALSSATGSFLHEAFGSLSVLGWKSSIKLVFMAIILAICVFYFTTMTVFSVVRSMLFIALLIASVPFALIFALFNSTRFIAQGWLSQLITYSITYFLTMLLVVFIFVIAQAQLEDLIDSMINGDLPLASNTFGVAVMMVVGAFSMKELPSLAGAIGGGVSLSDDKQFRQKAREAAGVSVAWAKGKFNRQNKVTT